MTKFTMDWISAPAVRQEHQNLPVRQVYIWYLTTDKKLLLVSKDGQSWQLPGGKPDLGESLKETAVRELKEETGVSINTPDELKFFGYYRVTKQEEDGNVVRFLQIRFHYPSKSSSDELKLSAEGEDRAQAGEDRIRYVRAVSLSQAKNLIPWLAGSGEFKELAAGGVLL